MQGFSLAEIFECIDDIVIDNVSLQPKSYFEESLIPLSVFLITVSKTIDHS